MIAERVIAAERPLSSRFSKQDKKSLLKGAEVKKDAIELSVGLHPPQEEKRIRQKVVKCSDVSMEEKSVY